MEEDPVPGIREERDRDEHRGAGAECACRQEPRDDRERVQQRHRGLRERTARDVEEPTRDEWRDRRAAEDVAEVDRMALPELHVSADVGAEVAPGGEGNRDRLDPPHREGDDEDRTDAPHRIDELEGTSDASA